MDAVIRNTSGHNVQLAPPHGQLGRSAKGVAVPNGSDKGCLALTEPPSAKLAPSPSGTETAACSIPLHSLRM